MNEKHEEKIEGAFAELTDEGFRLFKAGRLEEAEGRFRAALALDPENAYALSGLGDAAKKRGDFKTALGHYTTCLQHHPDNEYALYGLGDCYRGLNDYSKAIEIWHACLDRARNKPAVLASIADAYRKLSDFTGAKKHYEEALALDPGFLHAIKGLGYLYYDLKMFREGVFYWNDALRRNGGLAGDHEVLLEIGNCHRRVQEFAEALPYFERVMAIDPKGFAGNFGLADCCRGLNDFRRARQYYEKILEREPANASILTRAGDMCVQMDDLEAAAEYFNRALKHGENLYARLGHARILERKGGYRDALRLLEEAERRFPRNQRLQNEKAMCREKLR